MIPVVLGPVEASLLWRIRLRNVLERARYEGEWQLLAWFAAAFADVVGERLEDATKIYLACWLLDEHARRAGYPASSVDGELRFALRRLAPPFEVDPDLVDRLCVEPR